MSVRTRLVLALLALSLVSGAEPWAQQPPPRFESGDVVVSIGTGNVEIFSIDPATGAYRTRAVTIRTGADAFRTTGSAFDTDGSFYVTTFTDGANNGGVFKFLRSYNSAPPEFFTTGGNTPESIVFGRDGTKFIGHRNAPGDFITRLAPDGTLTAFAAETEGRVLARDNTSPRGTDWIDLAENQTTLFYTSQGRRIMRYDTAAGQLSDFATLTDVVPLGEIGCNDPHLVPPLDNAIDNPRRYSPDNPPPYCGQAFALRLLPDGGLIVADNINVKRLSATGEVLVQYDILEDLDNDVPAHDHWFSVNLDPDGTTFWTGDQETGLLYRFPIDPPAGVTLLTTPIDRIDTGFAGSFFGVSVFRERTQAVTPPTPTRCETTTLTVSGTGTTCGATLTATFSCGGELLDGKTITFTFDGKTIDAVTQNGVATTSILSPPVTSGVFPVSASFAGDDTVGPATGSGQVDLGAGMPTLSLSSKPGDTCGTVELSASLACGTRTLSTGSVAFSLDGSAVGAPQPVASNKASVTVPAPSTVGSYGFTAAFAGGESLADVSQDGTVEVTLGTPTLSVSSVPGDTCGTIDLSASLACGTRTLSAGNVSFLLDGVAAGTPQAVSSNTASVTVPAPETVGSHTFTAAFDGIPSAAGVSHDGTVQVTLGTPSLTVSSVPGDTCGTIDLSASLACGTRTLSSGAVTFLLDGAPAGTPQAVSSNKASISVPAPDTVGSHAFSAAFGGTPSAGAVSRDGTVDVARGTPTLSVSSVPGDTCGAVAVSGTLICGVRPVVGQSISFALGDAAATATTAAGGVATASLTSPLDPGTFPVSAAFAGTTSAGPVSGLGSAVVTPGRPTLTVDDVSGSTCGLLSISATLACGARSVANLPISFAINGAPVGTANTNAAGVVSVTGVPSPSTAGSFADAVRAAFAGTTALAAASDTSRLTLAQGCTPGLSLTKTANPTTYSAPGEVITYTYTLTNTGQVPLTSPFTVTDDKLGSIACNASTLAPQESLACQKTYAIKPGDIGGTAETLPKGVTANVNTGPWLQGVLSTQDTSINGAAGLADGIYPGWCIQDHVIVDLHNEPGTLYSTVGAALPGDVANLPWNEINYVLNHKIRGAGKTDLDFFKDVQTAIWVLLGEKNPDFGISTTARRMITDARANPTYVPGPDAVVAVVIYSDGMSPVATTIQESIIEVKQLKSITNHAFATARAGAATIQSNQAQATVRQALPGSPAGLMDAVAWGHQPSAKTSVTTSAFSTGEGDELLLAFVSADYMSGASTRVTGVTGAGLTWQLVTRANAQKGTSEIWRAFSPLPLAGQTVTAALSQPVASSITVVSFRDVDTSGVNGSGAIGAFVARSGPSGAPTAPLTATRTGSWIFAAGNDWDNAVVRVPVTGQSIVHQYLPPVGDTFWVQHTVAASVAGSTVTIQDASPTGDSWNLAAVEIIPVAAPVSPITPVGPSAPSGATPVVDEESGKRLLRAR